MLLETRGLGDALEAEAEALAKMRKRLSDAEQTLERHLAYQVSDSESSAAGQSTALDDEKASLQRQRRELLRRQRAFSLKCELAGRSAALSTSVAAAAAWTDGVPEETVALSDFLGGRTSTAQRRRGPSERSLQPEPEPEMDLIEPAPEARQAAVDDSPTVADSRSSAHYSSALRSTQRFARPTSPPRTVSFAPRAAATETQRQTHRETHRHTDRSASSDTGLSASASASTRASSPLTTAAVTPTRSTNGRYSNAASVGAGPLPENRELPVEADTEADIEADTGRHRDTEKDTGEEALGGARNATMKAAAQRAEQRLLLRPESETSSVAGDGEQWVPRGTSTAPPVAEQSKPLTRLERARQQASARISTGDQLLAASGSGAEGRQQLHTRSPSPPRTLSARMAASQQERGRERDREAERQGEHAHARGAGALIASADGALIASAAAWSPAFRQPRTASEFVAPTPPPMSPFLGLVEQQQQQQQQPSATNQAGLAADGLSDMYSLSL